MSNRTLIELNHDYCPRENELVEWALAMKRYMATGDQSYLPQGVVFINMRHHSEPDVLNYVHHLSDCILAQPDYKDHYGDPQCTCGLESFLQDVEKKV